MNPEGTPEVICKYPSSTNPCTGQATREQAAKCCLLRPISPVEDNMMTAVSCRRARSSSMVGIGKVEDTDGLRLVEEGGQILWGAEENQLGWVK